MTLPYDPQTRMEKRKPVNKSFERACKKELTDFTTKIRRSLKKKQNAVCKRFEGCSSCLNSPISVSGNVKSVGGLLE
jgi:hypothetical protein